MKRDLRYNYGHAVHQKAIEENMVPDMDLQPVVFNNPDPADQFLKIVYAQDPVSKLPKGDLQYMVSDQVNPEIKQWVIQNMLIDTSQAAAPAPPRGLSDEDIMALSRSPKETSNDYVNRINMYMKNNKEAYERMVSLAKESLEKRNVSPRSESTSVSSE